MRRPTNVQVSRTFDKAAGSYDRAMAVAERLFLGHGRYWATARARGDVLEIAVGTGLNLPNYPAGTRVLGVDLSVKMLAIAERRAADLGHSRPRVVQGDAQALNLPDASRDTVVSTYTFCTIPDPAAAAREAFRVLRPGGTFLLVEHGPSTNPILRAGQRLVSPITVRMAADHMARDPVAYLREAGFAIDEVHRTKAGIVFRVVATVPA